MANISKLAALLGANETSEHKHELENLAFVLDDYRRSRDDDGPRSGSVVEDLLKFAGDAQRLIVLLQRLDAPLRDARLPPLDLYAETQDSVAVLEAMIAAAKLNAEALLESTGPDKGGRGVTLRAKMLGSPRRRFFDELASFYFFFTGDYPTASDGGRFHELCLAAHEAATGEPCPPCVADMKAVATNYRRRIQLREKVASRLAQLRQREAALSDPTAKARLKARIWRLSTAFFDSFDQG